MKHLLIKVGILSFGIITGIQNAYADLLNFRNTSNATVTVAISQKQCFSTLDHLPVSFDVTPNSSHQTFAYLDEDCYSANDSASINYTISYQNTPIVTVTHSIGEYAGPNGQQDTVTTDGSGAPNCNFNVVAGVGAPVLYDQTTDDYTITGNCTTSYQGSNSH